MDFGILLLFIIGISLIILLIWNLVSNRQLKTQARTDKNLSDPRYYELKYKQEFFIATVSLIGTVIVVFGYNSLQNVEKALMDDFSKKTTKISVRTDSIINYYDTLINKRFIITENNLKSISNNSISLLQKTTLQVENTQQSLQEYKNALGNLNLQQLEADKKVKNVQYRIEDINSKSILKQNFYLVDSLIFDTKVWDTAKSEEYAYKTYFFKDMKTIYGDRLPDFKKPPFIIATVEDMPNGQSGSIKEITNKSFKFNLATWRDERSRVFQFSILVSEKPN